MSGLAGVVVLKDPTDEARTGFVEQACDRQAHRGPDERTVIALGPAVLGIASWRLRGSAAGPHAFVDAERGLGVTLDGTIQTLRQLKEERFDADLSADADAELILKAYGKWNVESFHRFSGPFAVSIYDNKKRVLTLGRDHYGLRPLHYRVTGGCVYFASEVKPLLNIDGAPRLNHRALLEWTLYGDVLPPDTLFEGIRCVPPGHSVEIGAADPTPRSRCYYRPAAHVDAAIYRAHAAQPVDEFLDEVDVTLEESVLECLETGAPVGVALSGGVDSGLVSAIAARHAAITAINVSSPDAPHFDERAGAERIAERLGVPLEVCAMTGEAYRRDLARVSYLNETPLWHMQSVGFHSLCQRARDLGIKLLLTGDALGTLLGGLERGRHRAEAWVRPSLSMLGCLPKSVTQAFEKLAYAHKSLPWTSPGFPANASMVLQLLDGCARSQLALESERAYDFVKNDVERRMLATKLADIAQWQGRFLHRGDRLGTAASLEYRQAFNSLRSVHLALNTPLRLNIRNGTTKWAVKEVACRYLPREIAFRKKVAWNLPADQYLRPLARAEWFEDGFCAEVFGLSREVLQGQIARWRKDVPSLFKMIHIESWGRLFFMGETIEDLEERIHRFEHEYAG